MKNILTVCVEKNEYLIRLVRVFTETHQTQDFTETHTLDLAYSLYEDLAERDSVTDLVYALINDISDCINPEDYEELAFQLAECLTFTVDTMTTYNAPRQYITRKAKRYVTAREDARKAFREFDIKARR